MGQLHALQDVGGAAEHPRVPLLEVQRQLVATLFEDHVVAPLRLLRVRVDDGLVVHGGSLMTGGGRTRAFAEAPGTPATVARSGVRVRGTDSGWDCRNAERPTVGIDP